MSDPTLEALAGLRGDVAASRSDTARQIDSLRTDLTGRLDAMVTRREHEAEVRRIDSQHQALAESHATRWTGVDRELGEIRDGFDEDRAERKRERDAAEASRRADRKWYAQFSVALFAVTLSAATLLFNLIR